MIFLWLLWSFNEIPQAYHTWNASFTPETALLKSNGESLLFQDKDVYIFDRDGNLLQTFVLDFQPAEAFVGAFDTLWIHDGENRLGLLNDNHNLQWQRELPPPSSEPLIYREFLVYVTGQRILVLDPRDGSARFSLYRDTPTVILAVYKNRIFLADENGGVLLWDPLFDREQEIEPLAGTGLQRLSFSPQGETASVHESGLLRVWARGLNAKWRRQYHIDIPVNPLWLSYGEKHRKQQLIVATHGRKAYAYGPRGSQLAKTALRGRPKALVSFSEQTCLIVQNLEPELIWYHSETQEFTTETLENHQILVLENGTFVLLIDGGGIMRLFQRNPA